jgi:hypothetical protein
MMLAALPRRVLFLSIGLLLAACSGRNLGTPVAHECDEGLRLGNRELEDAKVNGFGSSVQWIKAANLLAAASIQQQLERFDSCADKVRRARIYIREAQK